MMTKVRIQTLSFVVLCLITFFIWNLLLHQNSKTLTVAFLDIGQGDAIFIEAPNGNQVLIDGGSDKKILRELARMMPFYDRSIDVVIATHPDEDHIGGLPDIFERYKVKMFIEPGVVHNTGTFETLQAKVSEEDVEKIFATQNMSASLGGGVHLHILFPDRDVSGLESNTASIVAQLVYGDHEFLLTGDSPESIEKYLVSRFGERLKSDVLKVGHHGSNTSSSELFLAYVAPAYAVISAGEGNRYGHPHPEVVDVLHNAGAHIFETKHGTVVFESNGTILEKK